METLPDKVIAFRDPPARDWLLRTAAERTLTTGHRVELSEVARRVFAIGRAMVEKRPDLLNGDGKEAAND